MRSTPQRQQPELGLDREPDAVHAWRAERLASLGVRPERACAFAEAVDWHEVADLLKRGCPPELALEILR